MTNPLNEDPTVEAARERVARELEDESDGDAESAPDSAPHDRRDRKLSDPEADEPEDSDTVEGN